MFGFFRDAALWQKVTAGLLILAVAGAAAWVYAWVNPTYNLHGAARFDTMTFPPAPMGEAGSWLRVNDDNNLEKFGPKDKIPNDAFRWRQLVCRWTGAIVNDSKKTKLTNVKLHLWGQVVEVFLPGEKSGIFVASSGVVDVGTMMPKDVIRFVAWSRPNEVKFYDDPTFQFSEFENLSKPRWMPQIPYATSDETGIADLQLLNYDTSLISPSKTTMLVFLTGIVVCASVTVCLTTLFVVWAARRIFGRRSPAAAPTPM